MRIKINVMKITNNPDETLEVIKRPLFEWEQKFGCKGIRVQNITENYSDGVIAGVQTDHRPLLNIVITVNKDELSYFVLEDLFKRIEDEGIERRDITVITDE